MSINQLFSGINFERTISRYAKHYGWLISEIDDRHAVIKFQMKSGRQQVLYIIRYDDTLEFSVPSLFQFDSEDEIPHHFSTLLLQRNAQTKIGFWCIEDINQKFIFSNMHNAELSFINRDYFGRVVSALVTECDDFEGTLLQLLDE